jgi:hypothetical protein
VEAEIAALERLDIPYFFWRSKKGRRPRVSHVPLQGAIEALKRALSVGGH